MYTFCVHFVRTPIVICKSLPINRGKNDIKILGTLLSSMITKSPQNTSWVETSSHIRGLIWQVEVRNLCLEVIKQENIARPNIAVNNGRLDLFMQVLQPPSSIHRNSHTLHPVKHWPWLCSLNSLSSCNVAKKKNITDKFALQETVDNYSVSLLFSFSFFGRKGSVYFNEWERIASMWPEEQNRPYETFMLQPIGFICSSTSEQFSRFYELKKWTKHGKNASFSSQWPYEFLFSFPNETNAHKVLENVDASRAAIQNNVERCNW